MRARASNDFLQLFSPISDGLRFVLHRLHWWLILLALLYLGSGITTVQPNEVALVLRFGSLQNRGTAQAIHQPGLLLALPKPIDEVVSIPVKKIFQQDIKGLHFTAQHTEGQPLPFLSSSTIDPEAIGYALTGDGNVLHLLFSLQFQIVDPVAYGLEISNSAQLIEDAVQTEAIRLIAGRSVDHLLSDGRQPLLKALEEAVQNRLDFFGLGIAVVSLECNDLVPPYQVKSDFNSVQSSAIEARTSIQEAEEYRVAQIPLSERNQRKEIAAAQSTASKLISTAEGQSRTFESLAEEYLKHPIVLRSRLYREGIESALKDVGALRFIPPPQGLHYEDGFRLQVSSKAKR